MKNKSNFYFTQEIEDAIVLYSNTDSKDLKNELYKNLIGKTLKELIDNVVQVYQVGYLPNISFLKEECLLYLISVLNKFDASRGSKAFNYFTVITKHWFFFKSRQHKKQKFEESNIDEVFDSENVENISTFNEYDLLRENSEFKNGLIEEVKTWKSKFDNKKVIKVIDAIVYVFENTDQIDFLSKNGIYVYLREISGLETKEISSSIKKLIPLLKIYIKKWNNGEV